MISHLRRETGRFSSSALSSVPTLNVRYFKIRDKFFHSI